MIWINEERATDLIPGAPAALREWLEDDVVRVYIDWLEAVNHFEDELDYLGNLPEDGEAPGTWLRFEPEGLNILGEDHDYVIAETVVTHVLASKSFVFEGFVTEDLTPGSHLHALYYGDMLGENALDGLGHYLGETIDGVGGLGVDSMFARIGFDMAFIDPYLRGQKHMDGLRAGNYRGQPLLDGLRLAWAFAEDIAGRNPKAMTTAQTALAVIVAAGRKAELGPFVTSLRQGGHLGDSLTGASQGLMAQLRSLVGGVIKVLLEHVATATGITAADRTALGRMKQGTAADQQALFMEWRNMHIARNIADAAARGVRYAGIGEEHLKYLVTNNLLPAGSHPYSITAEGLADAVALTVKRKG